MLGFDPVSLSTAYLLVNLSQCPVQGKVEVDIKMDYKESPYITDLTARQMTDKFQNDLNSTVPTDGKWMTTGLTRSNIASNYHVEFATVKTIASGAVCFSIKKIEYNVLYTPDVYIASDYKNMGCRYSATLLHEKRHTDADRQTLSDYMPDMKKLIEEKVATIGPQGPYPEADVKKEMDRVIGEVDVSLKPVIEQLNALRQKRQAAIDTLQTYTRDTALCPGQFPKFE